MRSARPFVAVLVAAAVCLAGAGVAGASPAHPARRSCNMQAVAKYNKLRAAYLDDRNLTIVAVGKYMDAAKKRLPAAAQLKVAAKFHKDRQWKSAFAAIKAGGPLGADKTCAGRVNTRSMPPPIQF